MNEREWLISEAPQRMLEFLRDVQSGVWRGGEIADGFRRSILPRLGGNRRLRLFACACCRAVWAHLTDKRSRRAVEAAEDLADAPTAKQACHTRRVVEALYNSDDGLGHCCRSLHREPHVAAENAAFYARQIDGQATTQANLLRDIFNPFWPTTRRYLTSTDVGYAHDTQPWRDSQTTRQLAQTIYDERRFEDTPILADALEEAGCADETLLRHLRNEERALCGRCNGDGKAHGADRPFEWSADTDYGKCVVCKGTGFGTGWRPLRCGHVRGCWALDAVMGRG